MTSQHQRETSKEQQANSKKKEKKHAKPITNTHLYYKNSLPKHL